MLYQPEGPKPRKHEGEESSGRSFYLGVGVFAYGWSLLLTANCFGLLLTVDFFLFLLTVEIGSVFFASGSPPVWKLDSVFSAYGSATVSKKDEPQVKDLNWK